MDPHPFDLLGGAAVEEGVQLVDMAVDIAVRNHPDKMDRAALPRPCHDLFPGPAGENRPAGDGLVDQLRPLGEDPAGPEGVVADLGVAHIAVGGETDRPAVGLEAEHQLVLEQAIEGGGIGNMDAIAFVLGTEPDAVHDHGHHRSGEGGIAGKRLQGQLCHSSSFNGSPWR